MPARMREHHIGYNNPAYPHMAQPMSRGSLISPRNLKPEDAKELYYSAAAHAAQLSPNRGANAVDFWDAFVAKQNMRTIAVQANPNFVSSPRTLSPRLQLSPRNPMSPRRQNLMGMQLAALGSKPTSPRVETPRLNPWAQAAVEAVPTRAPRPPPLPKPMTPRQEDEAPMIVGIPRVSLHSSTEDVVESRFSDMQAAFRYIDVDNSGTISKVELERALVHWGIVGSTSDASVQAVLAACDESGRGEINYEEFVSAFSKDDFMKNPNKKAPPDPLEGAWGKLRPGCTPKMLRQAHRQIKDKLTTKFGTIARAFRQWDENKNGFLGRDEFDFGLLDLNLDGIPRVVIDSLLDIIDVDDDGDDDQDHERDHDIQLREFARVMVVEDLLAPDQANIQTTNKVSNSQDKGASAKPTGLDKLAARGGRSARSISPRPPGGRAPASPRRHPQGTKRGMGTSPGASLEVQAQAMPVQYRAEHVNPIAKDIATKKPAALIEDFLEGQAGEIKAMRHAQAVQLLRPGVKEQELKQAQKLIKGKIMDKYKRLDKAFKWMDTERGESANRLTHDELREGLAGLNLDVGATIREEVFMTLFDFMDADGDGDISFAEFARVLSADDIMMMAPIVMRGSRF